MRTGDRKPRRSHFFSLPLRPLCPHGGEIGGGTGADTYYY